MKIEELKKEINEWLHEYFSNKGTYEKILFESMAYSVNNGGKRIRPILMIMTYNIYKKDYKNILPFACALEMIHTYSLIHDDLPSMDNDDLRRGKPTNHKVYGEAIAILAGDALLNEGLNILMKECLTCEKPKTNAAYLISKASSADGMIAGQVVDIISENREISEDELKFMHKKKTGELIKVALVSGAILGEASEKDIKLIEEYGEKLGLAFQIKDDILDVEGDTNKLGKKVNSDAINEKSNFVTHFGLDKCKIMVKELTNECYEILNRIENDTRDLEIITTFLINREI